MDKFKTKNTKIAIGQLSYYIYSNATECHKYPKGDVYSVFGFCSGSRRNRDCVTFAVSPSALRVTVTTG